MKYPILITAVLLLAWMFMQYPEKEHGYSPSQRAQMDLLIKQEVPLSVADINLDAELVMETYANGK